ncbi:MAG: glycosyltransferase family 2 protein [Armatimonadota bacterium]
MASSKPDISVVVPLYNKEAYIVRCLHSVLGQTVQSSEIIVVNDGSSDRGAAIARELVHGGGRVIDQHNCGVSAARNRGMESASGEIIAFLDADDEWLPNHLEHIATLARRFPEAGLYGTGHERRGMDFRVRVTHERTTPTAVNLFRASQRHGLLTASSVAVRTDAFEACGGFQTSAALGEDMEWWNRLALEWPVAFHPDVSSIYHLDVADSAVATITGKCTSTHVVLNSLYLGLREGRACSRTAEDVEAYMAYRMLDYAWWCIARGRTRLARRALENRYLTQSALQREARMLRTALQCLPISALRLYYRVSRSRWCTPRIREHNGTIVHFSTSGSSFRKQTHDREVRDRYGE